MLTIKVKEDFCMIKRGQYSVKTEAIQYENSGHFNVKIGDISVRKQGSVQCENRDTTV